MRRPRNQDLLKPLNYADRVSFAEVTRHDVTQVKEILIVARGRYLFIPNARQVSPRSVGIWDEPVLIFPGKNIDAREMGRNVSFWRRKLVRRGRKTQRRKSNTSIVILGAVANHPPHRRVAEMEQKLDGLMALLNSQGRALDPTPSITPPPVDTLDCENFDEPSSILLNMSNQRHQILSNPHQFSLFSLPKSTVDIVGDVISKDIISYDLAAEYLQYYRTKSKYFPFVIISPHESLDSLRRERPFLLLAVLAMSAILSSTKLQKTLDLELRENLSRRTIVNGEKSLDLLQGLLVYLVWYVS